MRSRRFALLVHLVLLAGGAVMAFPFYWMLATSFKSPQEALQARPIWLPERMKPQNWLKAARLGDSPLLGGLGPGRSVELFFPAPEGKPPRALVPRTPGAFTDPRAEGTRVEVAYREGGYVVRLTNTTKGAFSLLPLVVLWPKEVPLQPPLPPDALRSQGEAWRLEWVNAVPGALGYVFHNYLEAWRAAPWGRYFFNSFFTAFTQVAVGLFLASLAAFALARIPFPGKEGVFVLILATMMVPGEVLLIPNYVLLARLGWLDTYYALIVPWLASVFGIFLLRQFYLSLPQDLFDAARIDGAGYLTQLFRIALPLSLPGLVSYGIFTFLGAYNALLWPLIVTQSPEMRTVQLGLQAFVSEAGSDYGALMAASTFVILPVILGYFVAQRQFIQGIARSGLK
jgi:multiple sugar transport system permease protein